MIQKFRKNFVCYRNLVSVIVHQRIITYFRYPVNAIGGIISSVLLFAMIFFGGQAIGFDPISESTAGLIIGYYLFLLSTQAYQGNVNLITNEAEWGTLERHFATPFGFNTIMIVKGVARIFQSFVISIVVLIILMTIAGEWFTVPILTTIIILFFTLIAVFGVGVAAGGLAVLYKRVNNITSLFNVVIIALIGAPVLEMPWLRIFPIVQGSTMLQQTVSEGTRIWEFAPYEIGILVAVGLGYFISSLFVFQLLHRRARDLGVLGHY